MNQFHSLLYSKIHRSIDPSTKYPTAEHRHWLVKFKRDVKRGHSPEFIERALAESSGKTTKLHSTGSPEEVHPLYQSKMRARGVALERKDYSKTPNPLPQEKRLKLFMKRLLKELGIVNYVVFIQDVFSILQDL